MTAQTNSHVRPVASKPTRRPTDPRLNDNIRWGTTTYVDAASRGFTRRGYSLLREEVGPYLVVATVAAVTSLGLGVLLVQFL